MKTTMRLNSNLCVILLIGWVVLFSADDAYAYDESAGRRGFGINSCPVLSAQTFLLPAPIIGAIGPPPINKPPEADAGTDITVLSEDVSMTLITGNATDDDPGDTLQYQWKEGEDILFDYSLVDESGECPLDLSLVPFTVGNHTLSLYVTDGKDESMDNMILDVLNSPPNAVLNGNGVYEVGDDITLMGSVWDFDGDVLDYQWIIDTDVLFSETISTLEGSIPVLLPEYTVSGIEPGSHVVILQIDDGVNMPVTSEITIEVVDTTAPLVSTVASHSTLWPPNHKMVDIVIKTNIYENSGLPVKLSAEVMSSEPIEGLGDGDTAPDWTEPVIDQKKGIIRFQLRSERSGSGDGRIYFVTITATDQSGNSGTSDVAFVVPHDMGK